MFSSKTWPLHCILQSKPRFLSSDHFFVFSVKLIHFTGGMLPVYTIYIQYILTIEPIYPRDTGDSKT